MFNICVVVCGVSRGFGECIFIIFVKKFLIGFVFIFFFRDGKVFENVKISF